jgi:hypothetical protein
MLKKLVFCLMTSQNLFQSILLEALITNLMDLILHLHLKVKRRNIAVEVLRVCNFTNIHIKILEYIYLQFLILYIDIGMLSGLKKIVGKNNSPNEMDASENLLTVETAYNLYTPSLKAGKKRKVADSTDSLNIKRQYVIFIYNY